jgi:gliding motility-associated-like protein
MKNRLTIVLLFAAICINAQVTLERQVVSCFGLSGSGSVIISSTAGQPEYTTLIGSDHKLTQGFHQPALVPLVVEYEILLGQCDEGASILILDISGCAESVEVFLDGELQLPPFTGLPPGEYNLQFYAGSTCQVSETIEILEPLAVGCDLIFYDAISPNGDGSNDSWVIENLETLENVQVSVQIINRWGMLVWSSANYGNDSRAWAGKSNDGRDLPDGTYYYKALVRDQVFEGYIELIR